MGVYMNQNGLKKVFQIGPNYAAGKDMLQGMRNTYKGEVIGQEMTRWPDQLDFSAELSKARAAQPDAIFIFYPASYGVQFITQYAQAGLKGQIPLYQVFSIDELSLPRLKEVSHWALPARRSGSTIFPTRPARNSWPIISPNTNRGLRTLQRKAMTRRRCSTARSSRSAATYPKKKRCAGRWKRPISNPCAATSNSATTTFRSRISICRRW